MIDRILNWFFGLLFFGLIASAIAFGVDRLTAKSKLVGHGVVVSKQYVPSHTSTGTGMGFGGSSGAHPVVVTNHQPEKWIAIIRFQDEVMAIRTTVDEWTSMEAGQIVHVYQDVGGLLRYGYRIKPH